MCNCSNAPIQFIIGDAQSGTPEAESCEYSNPDLECVYFTVFRNGFGFLHKGVHFNRLLNGGFKLLNGDKFNEGEMFTITKL